LQIDHCDHSVKQKAGKNQYFIWYVTCILDAVGNKCLYIFHWMFQCLSLLAHVAVSLGEWFRHFEEPWCFHRQGSSSPRPQNLLRYWHLKMKAMFLWYVGNCSHSDVISHPRRHESSGFILSERLLRTFCFLYCTVRNNW
jgi:hypothetical protein